MSFDAQLVTMLRNLARAVKGVGGASTEANRSGEKLANTMRQVGKTVDTTGGQMGRGMQRARREVDNTNQSLGRMGASFAAQFVGVQALINKTTQALGTMEKKAEEVGKRMEQNANINRKLIALSGEEGLNLQRFLRTEGGMDEAAAGRLAFNMVSGSQTGLGAQAVQLLRAGEDPAAVLQGAARFGEQFGMRGDETAVFLDPIMKAAEGSSVDAASVAQKMSDVALLWRQAGGTANELMGVFGSTQTKPEDVATMLKAVAAVMGTEGEQGSILDFADSLRGQSPQQLAARFGKNQTFMSAIGFLQEVSPTARSAEALMAASEGTLAEKAARPGQLSPALALEFQKRRTKQQAQVLAEERIQRREALIGLRAEISELEMESMGGHGSAFLSHPISYLTYATGLRRQLDRGGGDEFLVDEIEAQRDRIRSNIAAGGLSEETAQRLNTTLQNIDQTLLQFANSGGGEP